MQGSCPGSWSHCSSRGSTEFKVGNSSLKSVAIRTGAGGPVSTDDTWVEFFHLTFVFLAALRCQFKALAGEKMPAWHAPTEKPD